MSKKARRRPTWKIHKRIKSDDLIIHLINEENDRLMEIIRVRKMGYLGRLMIDMYGKKEAENKLKQFFIDAANETLAMKEYYDAKAV